MSEPDINSREAEVTLCNLLWLTIAHSLHPGCNPQDGGALACRGQAAFGQLGSLGLGRQTCAAARLAAADIAAKCLS